MVSGSFRGTGRLRYAFSHDGDEGFARHIANASRRLVNVYDDEQRQMHVIAKDRRGSPRKVDAAVAAVISATIRYLPA